MIEAVKNHNPQTIIIDEIATASDAQAVRNLVQRGVQVIATAHSCNFVDFFQNREFKHVSGMVQGDDGGHRTLPERVQDPAFQVSFHGLQCQYVMVTTVYTALSMCVSLLFARYAIWEESLELTVE